MYNIYIYYIMYIMYNIYMQLPAQVRLLERRVLVHVSDQH